MQSVIDRVVEFTALIKHVDVYQWFWRAELREAGTAESSW